MVVMNTQLNTPTQILYTVDFKLRKTTQRNAAIRRNINSLQPALLHWVYSDRYVWIISC